MLGGLVIGFRFLSEDHLREWRAESKGVLGNAVAIQVDNGAMSDGTGTVPWQRAAKCGDPQANFANGCGFRQCKSGKNRLFYGEDLEQVARVSVHCKLVTRATQLGAYSGWGQGGVKSKFCSRTNQRGADDE